MPLSVGLPAAAHADDDVWDGPSIGVDAQVSGNEAQVSANMQTSAGGGQAQAQPGYEAGVPGGAASGINPWAKYTLVTNATGGQQLCLTVNAGLPGGSDRVQVCYDVALPDPAPDGAIAVDPAVLAAQAVARLSVPQPSIVVSPHPSDNQWGVSAVGLPLWVWSADPGPVTSTVTEQGISIAMQASRGSVRFDWGDATSSVCNQMRPRPANMDPLTPSPDCGHTYQRRGDYTITATADWVVSWQALGQSGTLPLTSGATTSIPVREFQSLVVG
ncbi:MAG: hypothetical protein QM286_09030 [Acidobacteriota bacterium]|nr:hypothetical protein [Acidobacteriota bacterium]